MEIDDIVAIAPLISTSLGMSMNLESGFELGLVKYDFLGEPRNYSLFVFGGSSKGRCPQFIKCRIIPLVEEREELMYVSAWPGLALGELFPSRSGSVLPYPLNAAHRHSFCVARSGIYHLFRAMRLKPGETVLAPDYYSGNEDRRDRGRGSLRGSLSHPAQPRAGYGSALTYRVGRTSRALFT